MPDTQQSPTKNPGGDCSSEVRQKGALNTPANHTSNVITIIRVVAAIGALVFLVLASKLGAVSFHAKSSGSLMSNGKGGTMAYQDGFKVSALLGLFAAVWGYCSVRPKLVAETYLWSRSRRR